MADTPHRLVPVSQREGGLYSCTFTGAFAGMLPPLSQSSPTGGRVVEGQGLQVKGEDRKEELSGEFTGE